MTHSCRELGVKTLIDSTTLTDTNAFTAYKHGAVLASDERLERLCIEAGAYGASRDVTITPPPRPTRSLVARKGAVGSLLIISPCVVFVGAGLQSGEHMFPMVWLPEVSARAAD